MRKFALFIVLCLMGLCACSMGDSTDSDRLTVAVSIPPQAEFVREVCGENVDVITVIPAGYSPETYEPTPKDIVELSKADVYFTIGVQAEKSNIIPETGDLRKISLNEIVSEKYSELTIDGERDPHIWLSPKRASEMVSIIANEMSVVDPDRKEEYMVNAEAYIKEINEADEYARKVIEESGCDKFIVFHPAFAYFADEYGLEMYALEEHGKEATAANLTKMADFAKAENIKAVFYQKEIDSAQARAFAEEIGGVTVELSPLSENYTENIKLMADTISKGSN